MIAAPIRAGQEASLRATLAAMNRAPGVVDPENTTVPFGLFPQIHVARFVILADATLSDRPAEDALADAPVRLAFLGDCDGPPGPLLRTMAAIANDGLSRVFAHCEGFSPGHDLYGWMRRHSVAPAVAYVNWVGRTVERIREDAALHDALRRYLARIEPHAAAQRPTVIREWLISVQRVHGPWLHPDPPTPLGWQLRKIANLLLVPLALLLLSPFLLLAAPFYIPALRARERADPVIAPRPASTHVAALAEIEDHDVTNQFSAFGSVKPGPFRLWTLRFVFWLLAYSVRHFYVRGRLSRVGTIHFARWVFMDGHRRLFFASNYDGSLDSYMDDFINKVAFGLNLVFSNGIGYPRTWYLLCRGARIEQAFKNYLRRHQVPTQVWYKAYPGLAAADLARNSLIREGLERAVMTDAEARRWLALI
jgi:hypothetical protein